MSYQCTRARRAFQAQLERSEEEMVFLCTQVKPPRDNSRVLAAYYVLAYSQLEAYIKSLIEDALKVMNTACPALTKWPEPMLGYVLHKSEDLAEEYRRFGLSQNEGAIIAKLGETARKIVAWSSGAMVLPAAEASHFLEKRKYPSPRNLCQLFRRLGIQDVWAVVGKAGKINGEFVLKSLNDLRTQIAHEGRIDPGSNLKDFRDHLRKMRKFVAALDRGISAHFCPNLIHRATWNSAMK